MEKIIHLNKRRKRKSSVLLVIVALFVVAALVLGVYYIFSNGRNKGPSHGTYVNKGYSCASVTVGKAGGLINCKNQ